MADGHANGIHLAILLSGIYFLIWNSLKFFLHLQVFIKSKIMVCFLLPLQIIDF